MKHEAATVFSGQWQGVCVCGWIGPRHENEASAVRNAWSHEVEADDPRAELAATSEELKQLRTYRANALKEQAEADLVTAARVTQEQAAVLENAYRRAEQAERDLAATKAENERLLAAASGTQHASLSLELSRAMEEAKPRTVAEHLMSTYERVLLRRAEAAEARVKELEALVKSVRANCGCTDETDNPCANCLRIEEALP